MLSFLVLSASIAAPITTSATLPCDGVRVIEQSTRDRPLAFNTLRQPTKQMVMERNSAGRRVQREITVDTVKPIAGFARCRFVYSAQIDLACYVGTTLPDTDEEAIAAMLIATAESVGNCLPNNSLVRSQSEEGSTPSINFGGGSRQSFWQISMVPTSEDRARIQPEVLILGPAIVAPRPPVQRPVAKSKARTKRKAR